MAKKLYVGSLPFSTSEDELRNLFSAHGEVLSVNIIMDKFSGKSRGFAFVEMSDDTAALNAITALNNYQLGERTIIVNEARSSNDRGGAGGGGGPRRSFGGGGGGRGGRGGGYGGGGDRGGRGGGGGDRGHRGGGDRGHRGGGDRY